MKVRLAVLDLMSQFNIPRRGPIEQLAVDLDVSRQTVSKILNGHVSAITLGYLGPICEWLLANVPDPERRRGLRQILPGALLRYSGPWDALCEVDRLVLHLGERYFEKIGARSSHRDPWISGADSSVATRITQQLTSDGARFQDLAWDNVSLHIASSRRAKAKNAATDIYAAGEGLKKLKDRENTGSLLIGSQRVNLLTEAFIADLFDCAPFERAASNGGVPVFLRYREPSEDMLPDSCFGSAEAPPGRVRRRGVGCYWRSSRVGPWELAPFEAGKSDSGIVVVAEDQQRRSMQVALFGYSAGATKALGKLFCAEPHRFWPLPRKSGSRRFEVFVGSASLAGEDWAWTITPTSPSENRDSSVTSRARRARSAR
ncbi:MAG: hypothetical protein NXI31_26310 [bacterium]|nr:hypothetical protein [bacterium]